MEFCSEKLSIEREQRLKLYYGTASPVARRYSHDTYTGIYKIDTMPNFLRQSDYANWEKCDTDAGYNLISDRQGFIVGQGPSYVNHKIAEVTGHYLNCRLSAVTPHQPFHAKNWPELLEANGYHPVAIPTRWSVAVHPSAGTYGQVYWLETPRPARTDRLPDEYCLSTYIDGRHHTLWIKPNDPNYSDLIWYKIC